MNELFILEVFWRGLKETFGEMQRRSERFAVEMWDAFPNLLKMLDLTLAYSSGFAGYLVTIPIAGFENYYIQALRDAKLANRLIKTEDAVRLFFAPWKWLSRQGTLTSENGLLEVMAGWFARFVYRFTKRVQLLRNVIKAQNAAELAKAIVDSLRGKVALLRIAAIAFGIIIVLIIVAFAVWILALGAWTVFEADWRKVVLPQDSKIVKTTYKRKTVRRHRVNERTGPDQ